MVDTLFDPIFGELVFDLYWEGCIAVPGLGQAVHLMIETEEGPPVGPQREAFRFYRKEIPALLPQIESAIFDYYNQVLDTYRAAIGPRHADRLAPRLQSPAEIWQLLSAPGILIQHLVEHELRIALQWECTWDVENGLQVELEGRNISRVGLQV